MFIYLVLWYSYPIIFVEGASPAMIKGQQLYEGKAKKVFATWEELLKSLENKGKSKK